MKKFFGAVALCSAVLAVCSFIVVRVADADQARGDLVMELLSLPAPPAPNPLEKVGVSRDGDDAFFSRDNPPPDNAPIEDILDYWARQRFSELEDNNRPSPIVLDRIAAAMESDPQRIGNYLNYLKDSQRGINAVRSAYNKAVAETNVRNTYTASNAAARYDDEIDVDDYDDGRASGLKRWLVMNDPTFSAELEPLAANVKDTENGYIQNDDEFLALARNDWGRARPMVDKMYGDASQPASRTLATWALYKKALDDGSLSDAEKYREELKATVENRQLTAGVRDLALDALSLNEEWSGRDDWYFSLMKDPTMLDFGGYTGLTTLITHSKAGKYKAKMIKLLESGDQTVRAAAARNLAIEVNKGDIDAIKALLPWLEDPNWIKDTGDTRGTLVRQLALVKVPESVYGLIAVMNERVEIRPSEEAEYDGEDYVANAARSAVNAANAYRGPVDTGPRYSYPYRYTALNALKKQANPVAVPALRRLYNSKDLENYARGSVIEALFACGGFSIPEQISALENTARLYGDPARVSAVNYAGGVNANIPSPYSETRPTDEELLTQKVAVLTASQNEPADELVAAAIQRINAIEAREPNTAAGMRSLVVNWNTRAANAMQLADLKAGKAALPSVVSLLTRRKRLRETQPNDVYDARSGVPTAAGIATCILEDTPSYSVIMNDANPAVKSAFLACARLVRIPLLPDDVARELSSSDKTLALAAKLYLISEDSARSRQILYASFPNEMFIAGSHTSFPGAKGPSGNLWEMISLFASVDQRFTGNSTFSLGYINSAAYSKEEERFQKEVTANEALRGIYVYGSNIVRIYADRVTYDVEEDAARSYQQVLSPQEFDRLKRILAEENVGELKAFLKCDGGCRPRELLMLGHAGGSRIFAYTGSDPELFRRLDEYFASLSSTGGVLRYSAADKIPGLQVIFADPRLSVETVWANGADVRFFATDRERRKTVEDEVSREIDQYYESLGDDDDPDYGMADKLSKKREYDGRSWYRISADSVEGSAAPDGIELPPVRQAAAGLETFPEPWRVRAGGAELQTDDGGLYKVSGANRTKIADGIFGFAVISPDGRWVLARRYAGDDDEVDAGLVRIDTTTLRTYKVADESVERCIPVAWVGGVNKFLVSIPVYGDDGPVMTTAGATWIDPVSGAATKVSGDIEPLTQTRFRPLQPASAGGFWAAVADEEKNETHIGIYQPAAVKFTRRFTVPDIQFGSMEMWVDEGSGLLYFVYDGHLLRMPMGKN